MDIFVKLFSGIGTAALIEDPKIAMYSMHVFC